MRKIISILLAAIAVLFVSSCSKELGDSQIVGTWKVSKVKAQAKVLGIDFGINVDKLDLDFELDGTFTFDNKGNVSSTTNGVTVSGTYTLVGKTLTIRYEGEDVETFEAAMQSNRLTLTYDVTDLVEGSPVDLAIKVILDRI